jgi:glutamine amidotransferase
MRKNKICIIDHGVGNNKSVKSIINHIGYQCTISNDIKVLDDAELLILPGVGSFDAGIKSLHDLNLFEFLKSKSEDGNTIILGICLGMQLLFDSSEEGKLDGLGIIEGSVKKFPENKDYPVPHIGWNKVIDSSGFFESNDIKYYPRYYFVHSYYVDCQDQSNILGVTEYGSKFTSAVKKDKIIGVQFHPEKSHGCGMLLFKKICGMLSD